MAMDTRKCTRRWLIGVIQDEFLSGFSAFVNNGNCIEHVAVRDANTWFDLRRFVQSNMSLETSTVSGCERKDKDGNGLCSIQKLNSCLQHSCKLYVFIKQAFIISIDRLFALGVLQRMLESSTFCDNSYRNMKKQRKLKSVPYVQLPTVSVMFDVNACNFGQNSQEDFTSDRIFVQPLIATCEVHRGIFLHLQTSSNTVMDSKWSSRLIAQIKKRMLLDDLMNWLSTLGGAYSSLGEHNVVHALEAGKVSLKQLGIAMEMGDPPTVIRCHLYMALSLMQQQQLRKAKRIIRWQHQAAVREAPTDHRLRNMVDGLWNRLRYQWRLRIKAKSSPGHVNGLSKIEP